MSSSTDERSLRLRRALLLLWAVPFAPLFGVLHPHLPDPPIHRSLLGAAVFAATALPAFWLLGREKKKAIWIWRIVFVVWGLLVLPVLLTVAEGIAAEGWPTGRQNEPVARLLTLVLLLTVPGFLTGLFALLRTHRVTSALALATGVLYLVNGVLLIRATAASGGWWFSVDNVLNIILSGAKLGSYLSIPVGLLLIAGAIVTFRSARDHAAPTRSRAA